MSLVVYARQEPTRDAVLLKYAPTAKRKDTVFYRDAECRNRFAVGPWYQSGRPTRRRAVMLNCCIWRIEWLEDMT